MYNAEEANNSESFPKTRVVTAPGSSFSKTCDKWIETFKINFKYFFDITVLTRMLGSVISLNFRLTSSASILIS